MGIHMLHESLNIEIIGTYMDGIYFKLSDNKRKLVDDQAKEIYLLKRFLSISSNKLHNQSKQELKNNLVIGDGK